MSESSQTQALKEPLRLARLRGLGMPACRLCRANYPQSQFITGNGPRYLICVRCGVEEGIVTTEEVPQLYGDKIARDRTFLYGRRYGIWMTLFTAWTLWLVLAQGIPVWTTALLILLLLSTAVLPVRHILLAPRFKADLRRLTP